MKIAFTTLSLGENYTRDYCLKLINDVLTKTDHSIYITTDFKSIIDEKYPNNNRVFITEIQRENLTIRINTDWGHGHATDFNFNMRYMCLEPLVNLTDYVVIFTDCDNSLDWWDEKEIQSWLSQQIKSEFDFFAPRNSYVFKEFLDDYYRHNTKIHGLFWHKLFNYDLIENPKPEWDNARLPAEYLLIFYNRDNKLADFCRQWKWFHDYLVETNKSYGTWAEGFEIGVSAHVAKFIPFDIGWGHHIWGKVITPNGYKVGHPTES
jgi:hypothetical protein